VNVIIHYRITQDRRGIPQNYTGARHFVVSAGEDIEDRARTQLAADYQVPQNAVEISRIEN
jgi:hypothetical protein